MKINIAIAGAGGKMGHQLINACIQETQTILTVALEHSQSSLIGCDAGELAGIGKLDVSVVTDLNAVINNFDVLIDFTTPEATLAHLAACQAAKKRMVIGTTGFSPQQQATIQQAAQDIAIVFAPNMSIGINLVFKLLEITAQALEDDFDVEIIEAHHRQKIDAPSGSALKMGEIVAKTLKRDLSECAVYGRQGRTGERPQQTIGFETIRAGDIIGEHTVLFAGIGERLEITHRASSRMNFAKGAIRATKWIMQQNKGLFDMQDVLGFNK